MSNRQRYFKRLLAVMLSLNLTFGMGTYSAFAAELETEATAAASEESTVDAAPEPSAAPENPALPPYFPGGLVPHRQHPEGTQGDFRRHGLRRRGFGGKPDGEAYRKREKAHVGRIHKSWVRQLHRKSLHPIWCPET